MSFRERSDSPINNWILSTIPENEYERLRPHLTHIPLPQGQVLFTPDSPIDYAYFPNNGMVSLVSITEDGETVEVGMVSEEGMVGVLIILGGDTSPYQAEVQVEGDAMKLRIDVLKAEFARGGMLQTLLLRYIYTLIAQISQSAVCNRFHTVGERLCRWLLMTHDCVKSNQFNITQEYLAQMMGSHRPNVTVAARALQQIGLIEYKRGQMTIIDQRGLQSAACECYAIVKERLDDLLYG
jgi:CRP-like cAMP-binding protein